MDESLRRFLDGERGAATLKLQFLVDGTVLLGVLCDPARFEEVMMETLEAGAAKAENESDAATLRGLIRTEAEGHGEYLTLGDVTVLFATGQRIDMPVIRLRAESITAWWPVMHPAEDEEEAEVEEEFAESVDFRID